MLWWWRLINRPSGTFDLQKPGARCTNVVYILFSCSRSDVSELKCAVQQFQSWRFQRFYRCCAFGDAVKLLIMWKPVVIRAMCTRKGPKRHWHDLLQQYRAGAPFELPDGALRRSWKTVRCCVPGAAASGSSQRSSDALPTTSVWAKITAFLFGVWSVSFQLKNN